MPGPSAAVKIDCRAATRRRAVLLLAGGVSCRRGAGSDGPRGLPSARRRRRCWEVGAVVAHNSGLPSGSRQLKTEGYRRHRLGASRTRCDEGGGYLGIPRGAARIRGGEGPEAIQLTLEVATKLERVKRLVERVEFAAGLGGENAEGAEALVGGLGPVVDSVGARALASLRHELLDRLEEVDVQAGKAVDALQLRIGGAGREGIKADERGEDPR